MDEYFLVDEGLVDVWIDEWMFGWMDDGCMNNG